MEQSIKNEIIKLSIKEMKQLGMSGKEILNFILENQNFNVDIKQILTENINDEEQKKSILDTINFVFFKKNNEKNLPDYIYFITTAYSKSKSQFDFNDYINRIKTIESSLFENITIETDEEEKMSNFNNSLIDGEYLLNKPQNMILFLRIINNISLYHYRNQNFINKLEYILLENKNKLNDIDKYDILYIFRNNKRLLLFFFKNNIIEFNDETYNLLISLTTEEMHYFEYFLDMIIKNWNGYYSLTDEQQQQKDKFKRLPDNHGQKQENGENENELCELIRIDMVKEFEIFCEKKNIPLNSNIAQSIYETNLILIEQENVSLIEYAAFFGSIRIFKYLITNKVEPQISLIPFAIHGNNPEIFQYIEKEIKGEIDWLNNFELAIKYHCNELATYI